MDYWKTAASPLSDEHARTSRSDDLLLREGREVLGLDDDGHVDLSVSEELEDAVGDEVDHGGLRRSLRGLGGGVDVVTGDLEEVVEVDGLAVRAVLQDVEVPHTDLSEVSGVVLVEVDAVVVLTSGVSATSAVLAVLADASVTGADVSALLAVLGETGRLWEKGCERGGRDRKGRGGRKEGMGEVKGGETRGWKTRRRE